MFKPKDTPKPIEEVELDLFSEKEPREVIASQAKKPEPPKRQAIHGLPITELLENAQRADAKRIEAWTEDFKRECEESLAKIKPIKEQRRLSIPSSAVRWCEKTTRKFDAYNNKVEASRKAAAPQKGFNLSQFAATYYYIVLYFVLLLAAGFLYDIFTHPWWLGLTVGIGIIIWLIAAYNDDI